MVKLSAVIYTLAVAAGAVQAASLTARAPTCNPKDRGHLKCETSGGSPLVADCEAAINSLADDNLCHQSNTARSHCTTLKHVGTCKIDVCGRAGAQMYVEHHSAGPASRCKEYLRNLLHDCRGGAVVGGQVFPQQCSVNYEYEYKGDPQYTDPAHYRLQFSHAG